MKQDVDSFAEGLSNRLFFRLYQCANLLHKTGTKALEEHRITTQQWAILGALVRSDAEGGIAVGDLASYLMVSRQNLTGVLSRLEGQGYVERAVDAKDNRSRRIRLTKSGHKLWTALQPKIAAYYNAALEGFSSADKIHTVHYLDSLRANFRKIDSSQANDDE